MKRMPPDFDSQLREHSFRVTPGHRELLWLLWDRNCSLNVDEIAKKVDLNIVTVYRALNAFADAGLVLRGMGSGEAMEFTYPEGKHHHHLVCMDCGFIKQCASCAH